MFEKFILKSKEIELKGYIWHKADPIAVVIIIHGIGEYAARYDKIAEIFNNENIAVLSMDLRGHGLSGGIRGHASPRTAVMNDIDTLIEFTENKYGPKPIFVYGHSMGGNISLDYRRIGPNRNKPEGYIITGPWLILVKKVPWLLERFVEIASKIKPEMTMDTGLDASNLAHIDKEVSDYIKDPLVHKKISIMTAVDCMNASKSILANKCKNGKSILIMHGTNDKICSIEGSRKVKEIEGDNATLVEWEGLYHEIHNEKERESVIKTEIDWIKKILNK